MVTKLQALLLNQRANLCAFNSYIGRNMKGRQLLPQKKQGNRGMMNNQERLEKEARGERSGGLGGRPPEARH